MNLLITAARHLWRAMRYGLPLVALCANAAAQPEPACKVLDPELQGSYRGGCVNGLAEGAGQASGTAHYSGEFRAGKKHGKGAKVWPVSGDRYVGEFADDRKEGAGMYTWGANSQWAGERYTGRYVNDMRQGMGVYVWPTGDRYNGPWEADQPVGPATPAMRASARAYTEARAAIARPGSAVCREMKVGIAITENIRGTVLAASDEIGRAHV